MNRRLFHVEHAKTERPFSGGDCIKMFHLESRIDVSSLVCSFRSLS